MRAFANFILRGPATAVLVTSVTAVLSLLLPPFSHLSGAAVALVVLRKGPRDGLIVLIAAASVLAVVGLFSTLGSGLVTVFLLATLLAVWLPVLLAAQVLRATRAMGASLMLVGVLGALTVAAFYVMLDDVTGWWRGLLHAMLSPLLQGAAVPMLSSEIEATIEGMARIMPGIVTAAVVYTTMINLFIARWLQAVVYNPGGFRTEFLALRLGRRAAVAALLVVVLGAVGSGGMADIAINLALVATAVFSLQGLALAHAIVAAGRAHNAWLIGIYVLMIFVLPHVMLVLSAAGFADSWMDFRARLRISAGPPGQDSGA